ncbi:MAG: nucleotide sugar dehydrogenase, partial [Thermodesulfobacteriota bacterium]|nr:nucleotide sugar dehydrogenase [Thermodesulfobacteriota bacterium]
MITFEDLREKQTKIAVVGLGYVGLPLAVAFSKYFEVLGFDVSARRVRELSEGLDRTGEVSKEALQASGAVYTSEPSDLAKAGLIIVAVPTPIDANRRPDLKPIMGASETVGRNMPKGSVVVFESTVYPGLTEEVCVPILEDCSGFTLGRDFWIGYSPERINPGDKVHTLETIVKVVAGMDEPTAELLAQV